MHRALWPGSDSTSTAVGAIGGQSPPSRRARMSARVRVERSARRPTPPLRHVGSARGDLCASCLRMIGDRYPSVVRSPGNVDRRVRVDRRSAVRLDRWAVGTEGLCPGPRRRTRSGVPDPNSRDHGRSSSGMNSPTMSTSLGHRHELEGAVVDIRLGRSSSNAARGRRRRFRRGGRAVGEGQSELVDHLRDRSDPSRVDRRTDTPRVRRRRSGDLRSIDSMNDIPSLRRWRR